MNIPPAVSRRLGLALLGSALLLLPASPRAGLFGPKGGSPEEKRQVVRKQRDEMLTELYATKRGLKSRIAQAIGFATFKQTDMNLFMLSSGRGYGVLRDNRTNRDTYMCVASLGGGVGLGIKDLRVVMLFHDARMMEQFVDQGWQFGGKGDASVKYKDTGASVEGGAKANVDFKAGTVTAGATTDSRVGTSAADKTSVAAGTSGAIEIYQFTESGLSLQATVQGTKYWKDAKLNQ